MAARPAREVGTTADDREAGLPGAGLTRLARMHAALGEPVRLGIVEHLTVTDASPGELGAAFGLATNLLAHHLKVLADAGLVRRVRSEGDARRVYVQLLLDDLAVAALVTAGSAVTGPDPGRAPARVVFVCTHNSARSQLAAAAWRRVSHLPVASAGTHPAGRVHPRAVAIGRKHGLRLASARTARLDEVVSDGDLVVAVCDNAHEELAAHEGTSTLNPAGRLHWAVPDPVRLDTDAAFETAYTQITDRVARLADTVTA